jgi:hypothetical protein
MALPDGSSRLKEVMVFTDHFVNWVSTYLLGQLSCDNKIMMFSYEDDNEVDIAREQEL